MKYKGGQLILTELDQLKKFSRYYTTHNFRKTIWLPTEYLRVVELYGYIAVHNIRLKTTEYSTWNFATFFNILKTERFP